MARRSPYRPSLIALALLALLAGAAQAIVYCRITNIETKELTNGVQIVAQADGILGWQPEGGDWHEFYGGGRTSGVSVRFTNARLAIPERSIRVDKFPVSYIQLMTPQDAEEGVGVVMTVRFVEPATFTADLSQDLQSFIITVNSERTIERGNGGAAKPGPPETAEQISVHMEDGLVSVYAVKADIHKLMGEIAAQASLNIAVDDAVKHEVSLSLPTMPVDSVIRGIASGYGLALSLVDDVYMISEGVPTDLATYNRSGTESFPMRYMRAQTAASLLPTFLFSYLHVNREQNAVVVTAPTQMLEKIRTDLQKADVPPPQMMIEALAVELTNTKDLEAGLNWFYRGTTDFIAGDSTTGELEYRELGPEDRFVDPDDPSLGLLPTRELMVRLEALLANGKAEIRSCPRMAAMNGQRAQLFIGAQRFILVNYLQYGQQQQRIQPVDVGVKLEVTPWTGGNGEITTNIETEVSNIAQLDPQTGLPLLASRRAETTVRVKDGETVVIGGLLQRQEEITRRKVPFFGDLPIIGPLFRSKKRNFVNTELVLFLTPHLLTLDGHLADPEAEAELWERFLGEPPPARPQPPETPPEPPL